MRIETHRSIIVGACLAGLSAVSAAQVGQVAPGSVRIDGVSDEAAWASAPVHEIRHSLGGEAPTVATRFRLATDGEALLVAAECEQPDMGSLRAAGTTRDAAVWQDDCIEVFLDPTGRGIEYVQFIVNSKGACYDAYYSGGGKGRGTWDLTGLETAGATQARGWSVELRLPLAGFVMPEDPSLAAAAVTADSWRFNLAREFTGGKPSLLSFQPLSNFFDTKAYAPIEGLKVDFGRFRWRLGPLAVASVRPDPQGGHTAELKVAVENLTGRLAAFGLRAAVHAEGSAPRDLEIVRTFAADRGQTQQLPFALSVPASGRVQVDLALSDPRDGRLLATKRLDVEVDVSPLRLTVMRPFYRAAIYATMEVSEVELEVSALWPPELTAEDRLTLRILDAAGKEATSRTLTESAAFWGRHALPIPRLAPGEYQCEAELKRGDAVRYAARTPLHVYPPSASEVRVNEHLNVVINGRETFLLGFFHNPWTLPIGEDCNAAITYGLAAGLGKNPKQDEMLSRLGAQGRQLMLFPHPPDLWTHQDTGHPELARKPLPAADAARIGALVAQYRQQPGLLGWYMADEPNPATHHPSYMRQLAQTLRTYDPYHPAYISFNSGSLAAEYDDAVDMLGVHWYCMFRDNGPESPLATVADHMEWAKRGVGQRKAVVFSPQLIIYAHSGVARPVTHRESRCMAYLSIVHGARGMVWFCTSGLKSSAEIRIGMPYLVHELRTLEPIFLAHETAEVAVGGPGAAAVHAVAKVVGGKLYILAVNATPEPTRCVLALPERWRGARELRALASSRGAVAVAGGGMALDLKGYDVCILTTDPDAPVLPADAEIEARFEAQRQAFLATGNLCYLGAGATVSVSSEKDYGALGAARQAIDGYLDRSLEGVAGARQGSWLEVRFPAAARVGRIEVSSDAEAKPAKLTDYQLHRLSGGQLVPIEATVTEGEQDGVFTRVHRFPATPAEGIRLTLKQDMARAGILNEIQAFGSEE